MGQNFVSREEARSATCLSLCGQWLCLRAAAASRLWSVDNGIYVQCCVLFYFTFKKTLSEAKESVMFSTSSWHLTAGSSYLRKVIDSVVVWHHWQGLACLGGCFYFFNSETLHPLPAVNPSLWGGWGHCIAVCKLFYYFFIVIIKSLTFSSHHCEITDLFEWNVTLKRLVRCFLCRFSIGVGLGTGTRKWRGCWGPVNVFIVLCSRSLQRMEAASLASFPPGMSISVSLHSNWSLLGSILVQ